MQFTPEEQRHTIHQLSGLVHHLSIMFNEKNQKWVKPNPLKK